MTRKSRNIIEEKEEEEDEDLQPLDDYRDNRSQSNILNTNAYLGPFAFVRPILLQYPVLVELTKYSEQLDILTSEVSKLQYLVKFKFKALVESHINISTHLKFQLQDETQTQLESSKREERELLLPNIGQVVTPFSSEEETEEENEQLTPVNTGKGKGKETISNPASHVINFNTMKKSAPATWYGVTPDMNDKMFKGRMTSSKQLAYNCWWERNNGCQYCGAKFGTLILCNEHKMVCRSVLTHLWKPQF